MTNNSHQPRAYDAVLGGQTRPPVGAVVLGGIEGVKKRLLSGAVEQRLAALKEALKYGQPGLDLVIPSLQDSSDQIQKAAYRLLRSRTEEPRVKQALSEYNPYRFFECLQTLSGHPGSAVSSICLSADGQTLVSGGAYHDRTIKISNLQTGQEICTLGGAHSGRVDSLVLSLDGQTLVSGSSQDTIIQVWNLRTKRKIRTLNIGSGVGAIALGRDWQTLINGCFDCTVKIWNLQTGEEIRTLQGHTGSVSSIALSEDGQILASGSGDCTVKVWNLKTRQEICTLRGHSNAVTSVALSSNGRTVFSGSKGTIKVWDVQSRQEVHSLKEHSGFVLSLALSPDGHILFSGGNSDDKTIKIWKWETRQALRTLEGHAGGVSRLCLSADGLTLVSGSHEIKVWGMR